MPPPDDRTRLLHMLEAAREAMDFVRRKSRQDLEEDRKLALALVRLIEIIGEAAARLDEESRSRIPSIPWQDVIGMRNKLVHAYFEIDLDRVWATARKNLPELVEQLEAELGPRPS